MGAAVAVFDPAEYAARYAAWLRFYLEDPARLPVVDRHGRIRDVVPLRAYPR